MKKIVLLFLTVSILFLSCNKEYPSEKSHPENIFKSYLDNMEESRKKIENESINAYYEKLSIEERIGQLFLISIDGNSKEDVENIVKVNRTSPGGYLLFSFNIAETADDTIDFLAELKNTYLDLEQVPPYIGIDHEGGSVNRLRTVCSALPSQQSVARYFSEKQAEKLYELHGKQLNDLGIHVNIAPVVEVLTEENKEFLENRSFGDKQTVIHFSNAEINGMRKASVLPVLKHFPGNSNNDPHTGLPVLHVSLDELINKYLETFYQLYDDKMIGVLVAHTVTQSVDDRPACLSERMISMLSSDKDFNGLVFSDDLLMKALTDNGFTIERSLIEAVDAGINILMIAECRFDEYADILIDEYEWNEHFRKNVDESVKKILEWKVSCGLLERDIEQTGFFEYKAYVHLPQPEDEFSKNNNKENFKKAYKEAEALYNEVWWSR
ncbi:MAG: glycoside hydrolase family 3 protein [Treponema sp.]|nr:glycoside hydrolase family 3 protein [Candidatus Treponema caballi]